MSSSCRLGVWRERGTKSIRCSWTMCRTGNVPDPDPDSYSNPDPDPGPDIDPCPYHVPDFSH